MYIPRENSGCRGQTLGGDSSCWWQSQYKVTLFHISKEITTEQVTAFTVMAAAMMGNTVHQITIATTILNPRKS